MDGTVRSRSGGAGIFEPALLDPCISCGFCLPACPTYRLTGDETSSPRGRITLMRALEDGTLPPDDPTLLEQSSFCLGCRACEPVCPAGVHYGQLLERWRSHQWQGRRRPLLARLLTTAVRWHFPVRLAGLLRGAARARTGAVPSPTPQAVPPSDEPAGPALMVGCFEQVLQPHVSRAACKLAPELAVPAGQGCCGALHAHNGDHETGERMAHELGARLPGTIVTTAGGCAGHLAQVLGADRVVELSTYLARRDGVSGAALGGAALGGAALGGAALGGAAPGGPAPGGPAPVALPASRPEIRIGDRRARVTLQDSCHLRNGMGVVDEPRDMLRLVADYVELPGAGDCCGSAGSYSLLRPRDSRQVLAPKLDAVEAAGVDFVVAVNPGCLRQLQIGLRRRKSPVRAVHIAELLSMAGYRGAGTPTAGPPTAGPPTAGPPRPRGTP